MTPELEALARRAVACPKWRWMDGMRVLSLAWAYDGPSHPYRFRGDFHNRPNPTAYPDLTDPATLGCLLALVREVYPGCYAEPNGAPAWDGMDERERDSWWRVYSFGRRIPRPIGFGPIEAAALVAALEAAP